MTIPAILNSMRTLFVPKNDKFITRRNEIITSWENPQSNTIFADCLFISIEASQDNGGAICVDKEINITIKKTKFLQCSCMREGGSLYISGANASLFCLVFIRSHTKTRSNNVGGNAFSMFNTELRMSDFVVSESWTDSECGDSVHHIVCCSSQIARYNISDSIENSNGGACGDFWTQIADSLVSFANLFNNWGADSLITYF